MADWWKKVALVLAAVGAINWGLVQLNFNVVDLLLGWAGEMVLTIVYYLVGLCGIYALVKAFK
jgi:uncharacterized membrane protein YuzA (DUF378 family)